MEKHTVITLSLQQRDEIVILLDGNNPNKARHVANFLERLEPQDVVSAVMAQDEIDKLRIKLAVKSKEKKVKAAKLPATDIEDNIPLDLKTGEE